MDKWKYYAITHHRHLLCNSMNTAKFERLCQLLQLPNKAHVLDIACGKEKFLIRLARALKLFPMTLITPATRLNSTIVSNASR